MSKKKNNPKLSTQEINLPSPPESSNSSTESRSTSPAVYNPISLLDLNGLDKVKSPLRGFIYLFWLSLAFYGFLLSCRNYQSTGTLFTWRILQFGFQSNFFASSTLHLFYFTLIFIVGLVFNYSKYLKNLKHLILVDLALILISWSFSIFFDFKFFQSLVFSLFSMTMIMKLHSFLCYAIESPSYEASISYFAWFLVIPTIVFYPNFPVKSHSLPLKNITGILIGWFVTHITIEYYIYPVIENLQSRSFLDSLCRLFFPFLLTALMLFLTFFENFLGLLADASGYGHRHFYGDWWNSISFEEFARNWNLPVHFFIKKHVYEQFLYGLGLKKHQAMFYTFLLSSVLHEFIIQVAVLRPTVPFLFFFQMMQIPFSYFGKKFKNNSVVMNMLFWFKMIVGPPLITLLYCKVLIN